MLTFDEKNHFYYWNGVRVPSTTQVCDILAPRTWPIDDYYKTKGEIIHTITEYEDAGELDESSVDENLVGYLSAYRQFKKDTGFKVVETELKFYSKHWGYAGRADKYGELFSYLSVLDIKSGIPHDADKYQSAAYLFGLKDDGHEVWRAWDLYLKANGKYRLNEQKLPSIVFSKFMEGVRKWRPE